MQIWLVLYDDDPEMLEHRTRFRQAHLDYLAEQEGTILVGGGLRPEPGAPFHGGMWLVRAESRAEVETVILNDPYYRPKHRRYTIHAWGKALDRPVTL